MSKGASRAPQEIRMDFAVLPVTFCQGLFHRLKKYFIGIDVGCVSGFLIHGEEGFHMTIATIRNDRNKHI